MYRAKRNYNAVVAVSALRGSTEHLGPTVKDES